MNKAPYHITSFNRTFTKYLFFLKELFARPIYITAVLHYSYGRLLHRNWGDDINIFFLKELFQRNVFSFLHSLRARFLRKLHLGYNYLIIGSSITKLTNERSIIWGAGAIDDEEPLRIKPKKVLAVRGPKTREYLLRNGVECPAVYGDPAMLIKYFYNPKIQKDYKLGIIPHFSDFDSPLLDTFRNDPEVLLIRMEGYEDWHDVIDEILSCEYIASSSLHGLIMAETFSVPNMWIEISGKAVIGGHFKFEDFYESIGKKNIQPYRIDTSSSKKDLLLLMKNYQKGEINLNPLISNSPMKLTLPLRSFH